MDSRRRFLKKAMLLAGAAGVSEFLPAAIQKAFSIDPAPGTTFMDAEHVVLLMQENRSFDHTFGHLQGVRGFNDPRAIQLPNKLPVWAQANEKGETFVPFHFNIKDTRITWMGSLPHGWADQVDARNEGKHDRWLQVKKSGNEHYEKIPMTMGYYTREDLPFYYALADAFTVCDQHFCSSLTGTTPNRLHFWTGTIRARQDESAKANVWNEDVDYNSMAQWRTFPELLEQNDISWKIYQNDISIDGGFTEEEDAWLSNFTDNPLEFFSQYNVKLSTRYIHYLEKMAMALPAEIAALEKKLAKVSGDDNGYGDIARKLAEKKVMLEKITAEREVYTREKYEALSPLEKALHEKAFVTNKKDPDYHHLTTLRYKDGEKNRKINIPRGDILYQFREDVHRGTLPTVSWIVAPENFSDHPDAAWFGAWYVSEIMDILTQNPEVWRKTIFILTYDENDGYFDHCPPFVAPHPHDKTTGKTSAGLDTAVEYVTIQQERGKNDKEEQYLRQSSIGLGYRVPMVVASPWTRGGFVCSEVFDHTSTLQFLEVFLTRKSGKTVRETNISAWRRAICGDLTSLFRPYNGERISLPVPIDKNGFIETIHKARFKKPPRDYKRLSREDMRRLEQGRKLPFMPHQEGGIRRSNALPYEIYADGHLLSEKGIFEIVFEERNTVFGEKAAGVPFLVYARDYRQQDMVVTSYAVSAGDRISDEWQLTEFAEGSYNIAIHGPNGFYRQFTGNHKDPKVRVDCQYQHDPVDPKKLTGNMEVSLENGSSETETFYLANHYNNAIEAYLVNPQTTKTVIIDLNRTYGWYDFSVTLKGDIAFGKRYAGRIETGKDSYTDPAISHSASFKKS